MTDTYRRNGKQILYNDTHFADARDETAAARIVAAMSIVSAMNGYDPRGAGADAYRCARCVSADLVAPKFTTPAGNIVIAPRRPAPAGVVGPDEC